MFHVPFDTDEAHAAMRKVTQTYSIWNSSRSRLLSFDQNHIMFQIAGDDGSWSCVGESVLDVLLEMERERDKKEKVVKEILPRVYPRNPLTKLLISP